MRSAFPPSRSSARTARITMAEPSEPTWFEDMTKRVREVQRDEAGNLTTESYLHVCEGNLKIFTIIFNGYAGAPASPCRSAGPKRRVGRGWLAEDGWRSGPGTTWRCKPPES